MDVVLRVFACGNGTYGQLGLGHTKKATTPTRIASIQEKVKRRSVLDNSSHYGKLWESCRGLLASVLR